MPALHSIPLILMPTASVLCQNYAGIMGTSIFNTYIHNYAYVATQTHTLYSYHVLGIEDLQYILIQQYMYIDIH